MEYAADIAKALISGSLKINTLYKRKQRCKYNVQIAEYDKALLLYKIHHLKNQL